MSKRAGHNPMDDLTLEEALEIHFAAEPAPEFLAALEQKLMVEQAQRERQAARSASTAASPSLPFWQWLAGLLRPRPAAVAIVLLLVLLVPLLVIGPRRAWAGLQAWLGYVPGAGFVDLEDTRLLLAPAAETRDGVTLRVTEVIAGPEETTVVVESEGLADEEALGRRVDVQTDEPFTSMLRLPDGSTLPVEAYTLNVGQGTLVFPPLPTDAYRVTLELPSLPLAPVGVAPEQWSLPLTLQPATGELVAAMYPQPYRPQSAVTASSGITFHVLEVVHTPEATVLAAEVEWQDPAWRMFSILGGNQLPLLVDETGKEYWYGNPPGVGSHAGITVRAVEAFDAASPEANPTRYVEEMVFAPVPPTAERLQLRLSGLEFDIPANASFTLDLGSDPQIGDEWEVNQTIEVAGFPVHITSARLTETEGTPQRQINLEFDVEPVPSLDGRQLRGLVLQARNAPGFIGNTGGYQPETNQLLPGLIFDAQAPLPTGQIEVNASRANVLVTGNWEVSWPIPQSQQDVTPPD